MAATAGYQAGTEANQVEFSYGVEATWGTAPAAMFQAVRLMSETLAGSKTRARPTEINPAREVIAAVTTQEQAGGALNFALSYGTFDDLLSVLLGSDWGSVVALAGVSADITITDVASLTGTLSSTTTGKFANIAIGQWIRTLGFTNAANNDFWRVTAKADNQTLSVTKATAGVPVTETPTGAAAKVRAQTIANGTQFKSLYGQKKFSSSLWLRYPGTYVTDGSITSTVGQFLSGAFNVITKDEEKATADASTGGVTAAPTGRVHDPVGGWRGVYFNNGAVAATVSEAALTLKNNSAALEFGLGSAAAAGVLTGTFGADGTVKMYFKDFTQFDLFKAETAGSVSFISADAAGNAYVFTFLNANFMNPQIVAGGVGQAVMATFQIEGNPQTGGGTFQIDKLPAT